MTLTTWLRVYRVIVRAARHDAADLRGADAEATFTLVCDNARRRGRVALATTAVRELAVIAGVVVLARLGRAHTPSLPHIADSIHGLRIGVRSLVRSHRGYVRMATFTLSVAVGVNLLVFTIVNALWIRPLPFVEPHRVVTIQHEDRVGNRIRHDLADPQLRVFEGGVAGQVLTSEEYDKLRPQIEIAGRIPETLGVTSGYFRLLGLPIRGRGFTPEDERDGAEPIAIISERLWSAAFGRRAEVIGAVVPAQPFSIRIIGIAPADFAGARRGEQADMWIPLGVVRRLAGPEWTGRKLPLIVLGRLGPGQTVHTVDAQYWQLTDPQLRDFMLGNQIRMDLRPRVVAVSGAFGTPKTRTFMVSEGDAALVVAGLALLVLLGGCATIAALVLVHYERRRAELAVRMSLGATRGRLVTELLRDQSVVAIVGATGGIVVAALGVRLVPALSLPGGVDIGRLDLSIDWRVFSVAIAATVVTMLGAAALPISRATRPTLAGELISASTSTTLASQRVRQWLLALQVCATIVVLISAGLFVRTVIHGFGTGPGFDVERSIFVSVDEPAPAGAATADRWTFFTERNARLMRALRALPGVTEVAEGVPPIGPVGRVVIKSLKAGDRAYEASIGLMTGSPELLSALGTPILAGRPLAAGDSKGAPYPALISQSIAERLWPDGAALGETFAAPNSRSGPFVVVGIIPNLPFASLADPGNGVIVTAQHRPGFLAQFVVRTDQPSIVAADIRRTIRARAVNVITGREIVARDLGRQRLGAFFFSGFGFVALLLGIGGAFGLVSYLAESQRREFGVRLALGATMAHLVRRGLAAALVPVSAGVVSGLFLAGATTRGFASLLAGIGTLDVVTYVSVAGITLASAAAAALAAAWRLRRISPSDALRTN